MHRKAGLWRLAPRGDVEGACRILAHLRKRVRALARTLSQRRRSDGLDIFARLEEADRARGSEPMPLGDIWAALRSTKGEGGGAVANIYLRDDPVANPVPISDPAQARAELARTGVTAMVDMRDEGFHEEAHEAWADANLRRREAMAHSDFGWTRPWTLEDAQSRTTGSTRR
jgi:hypothetical protein